MAENNKKSKSVGELFEEAQLLQQATFETKDEKPEESQIQMKASGRLAEKQKEVREERVGIKEFQKPMEDLERLEFMANYTRRYKEAMASLQYVTDPRNPTELPLAIGADTKEVFKETAKKLGETIPVPPNYQNADVDKNQTFITAALAAATSAIGAMRTGDPLAGAAGGMGVLAGGLESQAKLIEQKNNMNAALYKQYASNVKDYRDSIEKIQGDFLKQTGANERKLLEVSAKHWNDKQRALADQRETTLQEKKAELDKLKTMVGVDQAAIDDQQKIIDTKLDNIKAKKQVMQGNADRNLKAQMATNAAISRAANLNHKMMNVKHNKLMFSRTEKAAQYTPAALFSGNQIAKADQKSVTTANGFLYKYHTNKRKILNQFSPNKILRNPKELLPQLEKAIDNTLALGVLALENKDVIYDFSPELLLTMDIAKTSADKFKAQWPQGFKPVISGVPIIKGERLDVTRALSSQQFFEMADALLRVKEQVGKEDYDELLRDKKRVQRLNEFFLRTGVKQKLEKEDIEERLEDLGASEKKAEQIAAQIFR